MHSKRSHQVRVLIENFITHDIPAEGEKDINIDFDLSSHITIYISKYKYNKTEIATQCFESLVSPLLGPSEQ